MADNNDQNNTNNQDPNQGNQDPNQTGGNNNPPPPNNAPDVQAQIADLIAKARKEEKDKLYPELQTLRKQAKESDSLIQQLTESVKTLTAQLNIANTNSETKALTDKITQLETELKAIKEGSNVDNNNNQPQNNQPQQVDITQHPAFIAMQETLAKQTELLEQQTKEAEARKAAELRQRIIASQEDDNFIADMVTGNTEEEINASLTRSRELYQQVYRKAQSQATNIPNANGAVQDFNTELSMDQIQNMSLAEWAEYRTKLGLK